MDCLASKIRIILCAEILWMATGGGAQQPKLPAEISYSGEDTIVTAQGARPLYLALAAISDQYGWTVDYEDPIYSSSESTDAAAPEWRRLHPREQGLLIPSGKTFVANLGRIEKSRLPEILVLNSLVKLYNQALNPGYFQLIQTASHRVAVSGWSRTSQGTSSDAILDSKIQPGLQRRVASAALQILAAQCGSDGGVPIELGLVPQNALNQSAIDGYKGSISCRDQLGRILAAMPYELVYDLFYDIGSKKYYLSIVQAHQTVVGPDGKSRVVPLRKDASK